MATVKTLSILGLGLMGGSLGLAAKRLGAADRVVGYARRAETRRQALALGVVDEVFATLREAVLDADMVVVCVPILATAELLSACGSAFQAGCTVTDVGSTKAQVIAEAREALSGHPVHFVGSHPIAGSEMTGLEAARADLYTGATVVVTNDPGTDTGALRRTENLWKSLGAVLVHMPAASHDCVIARTSHLPHLMASILVKCMMNQSAAEMAPLFGTGFRDTTRIAGGSDSMWHDIVRTNADAIQAELTAMASELSVVRSLLEAQDFDGLKCFLNETAEWRQALDRVGANSPDGIL